MNTPGYKQDGSYVSPIDVDRPTQISPESMPLQWDYQDTPRHTSQKVAHSAALCTGTPATVNISCSTFFHTLQANVQGIHMKLIRDHLHVPPCCME